MNESRDILRRLIKQTPQTAVLNYTAGLSQTPSFITYNNSHLIDAYFGFFELSLNVRAASPVLVYWALVFVENPYTPNIMSTATGTDLYSPGGDVIESGSFIADTQPQNITINTGKKFRKLRKGGMSAGDGIFFITISPTGNYTLIGTTSYRTVVAK